MAETDRDWAKKREGVGGGAGALRLAPPPRGLTDPGGAGGGQLRSISEKAVVSDLISLVQEDLTEAWWTSRKRGRPAA
jgi:hypothetical protein